MVLHFILQSVYIMPWALLLLAVIYEIYFKKFNRNFRIVSEIPGPPAKPVVGHLLGAFENRESKFLSDRRRGLEFYPIYKMDLLHLCRVVLISPDDVEQVLSSMKHITKGMGYDFLSNWLGTGLLTSSGNKWQIRRKILTPAFHFNILMDFLNVFNEETKHLVKVLKQDCHNDYIDVVKPITEYTLSTINVTAMGTHLTIGATSTHQYKEAVYRVGEIVIYRALRPWLYNNALYNLTNTGREERRLVAKLHDVSYHVIRQRENQMVSKNVEEEEEVEISYTTRKRLAMLDLLLKAKGEGRIDYEGIREEVDTFMFEGHDTTSMALCFALLVLANHKEVQEKILEEVESIIGDDPDTIPTYNDLQNMKYLERCIKEILRLYPSVPLILRVAGEEFTTSSGYLIPKGTLINIQIYDLHHNPHVFEEPEKFDPDRFLPENTKERHPYAYVPFSAGPRNCIGQKFAMLELKTTLCGILRSFRLEPVHKIEDVVMISDIVLRPNQDGIKVKFVPRN